MAWLHPSTTARPTSAARDSLPGRAPVSPTRPRTSTEDALAGLLGLGSAPRIGSSPSLEAGPRQAGARGDNALEGPHLASKVHAPAGGVGRPGVSDEGTAWAADTERREALAEFAAATATLRSAQQATGHWPTTELDQPVRPPTGRSDLHHLPSSHPHHFTQVVPSSVSIPAHLPVSQPPASYASYPPPPAFALPVSYTMAPRGSHESLHPRWSQSSQGSHATVHEPVTYQNQGRRGSLSVPPPGLSYPPSGLAMAHMPQSAFPPLATSLGPHAPQLHPSRAAEPYQYFAGDVSARPSTTAAFPNEHSSFQRHRVARQRSLMLHTSQPGRSGQQVHRQSAPATHGVAFPLPPRPEDLAREHSRKRGLSDFDSPAGGGVATGDQGYFVTGYSMAMSPPGSGLGLPVTGRPASMSPTMMRGSMSPSTGDALQGGQYSPRGTCYQPSSVARGLEQAPTAPAGAGWDFELPTPKRRRTVDVDATAASPAMEPSSTAVASSGVQAGKRAAVPPGIRLRSPSGATAHPAGAATVASLSKPARSHGALPSPLASASFFDNSEPAGAASAPQPADAPATSLPPNYPVHNLDMALRSPPASDFVAPASTSAPESPGSDASAFALPREQPRRWAEDGYTPLWVRKDGKAKEGWCALCPGAGKWLCLKNSEYWYHRQFHHGVSSTSGRPFLPPYEVREVEKAGAEGSGGGGGAGTGKLEGLCHSCGDWQPYSNPKPGAGELRGAPNVWFRHAHSCHVLIKPKREKMQRVSRRAATPEGREVPVD